MKKITVLKVKKELVKYHADESTIELILNNIHLYNDLIDRYDDPTVTKKDFYLIYQLNSQIVKQIDNVKKINERLDIQPEDGFSQLLNSIKGLEKRKS